MLHGNNLDLRTLAQNQQAGLNAFILSTAQQVFANTISVQGEYKSPEEQLEGLRKDAQFAKIAASCLAEAFGMIKMTTKNPTDSENL